MFVVSFRESAPPGTGETWASLTSSASGFLSALIFQPGRKRKAGDLVCQSTLSFVNRSCDLTASLVWKKTAD